MLVQEEIIDSAPWWAHIDRDAVAAEEARWEEVNKLQQVAVVGPPVSREEFWGLSVDEQETLIGWLVVAFRDQYREEV